MMQQFLVGVKSIYSITHNVVKIVTEKPAFYNYLPGQSTNISINKPGWNTKKKSFSFTSIPANDYLEFTIKLSPERNGFTNELLHLKKEDQLIVHDVFGTFNYVGEGVFIAGGAGITPFLPIIRHLHTINQIGTNKLIFANKTKNDIIYEDELKNYFGKNCFNILSAEKLPGYDYGRIDADYIKSKIGIDDQFFYLCGPPVMVADIEKHLLHLQVDENSIIKEVGRLV